MKKELKGKYGAIVCELENVREHPNADRMKIATAAGYNVIVGLNANDGDRGIVFPEGGRLSHEMAYNNKLYRKTPVTGERQGGYFEENARVKVCKLRGQISEAFFTSFESLNWAGYHPMDRLNVGDEFDFFKGKRICEKYYTLATIRAMNRAANAYKKPWYIPWFLKKWHKDLTVNKVKYDPCPDFKKHTDTTKLRQYNHMIPDGLVAIFSSKRHGTSQRFGFVKYDTRNWWNKFLDTAMPYHYVTGTRNVTKKPNFHEGSDDGYYGGTDFRGEIHKDLMKRGLMKDEVIYFEVLGFANDTTPIMPNHTLKYADFKAEGFTRDDFDDLVNTYGETITYHYGNEQGKCSIEVYRIVQNGKDLSDEAMRDRCLVLGLDPVPKLDVVESDIDLMDHAKNLAEMQDKEDGQLREGVVIRLETKDGELVKLLKYKSSTYCILENIKRNDVDYVDREEIS